jgi:IMP dehydrogenase
VGATGDYLERADELLRAGADVLVIDIAHGHSEVMERAIHDLRKSFGDVELVAGNVATSKACDSYWSAESTKLGRHWARRRLYDTDEH